ncbi:S8/S53 family peptidase [Peptostreptococcus anaerobius]
MLSVAIIDTGVDFFDEEVKRMKFVMKTTRPFDDNSFYNLSDINGHGTIAIKQLNELLLKKDDVCVIPINIYGEKGIVSSTNMVEVLDKILDLDINIIVSMSSTFNYNVKLNFYDLAKKFREKNIIFISSDSNKYPKDIVGKDCFPACLENVYGVRADNEISNDTEFKYDSDKKIQFKVSNKSQTFIFKNKEMVFRKNSRGAIVLLSIFLNAIKDANINTINIQSIENKLEKEGVFF